MNKKRLSANTRIILTTIKVTADNGSQVLILGTGGSNADNYTAFTGGFLQNRNSTGGAIRPWANGTVNITYDYNKDRYSVAWNATDKGETSISNLSNYVPTIAVIVAAAILIGTIGAAFFIGRRGGGQA